jgi:N-acetylglucosamine kinase-like BadF-type ATPase
MRYFLGVDIGGTKSHAIIADETGAVKGFAHAGAGNHEVVGYEGLSAVLQALLADATAAAAIDASDLAGAGFGVAGYDWPSERQPTLDAIVTLGLHCPVEAVNDTIIGLLAGAEAGWGVAIVGGTSNNCRGWDRHHREGRVLGNGIPFGEYGGAVEAVLKAVHAVAAAWTRRGPATSLSDAFVALVGARDVADLLEGLSQEIYTLGADAARTVVEHAQAGDLVAIDCVRWCGEELASLAIGVIRQLELQHESFEVVLVGSFFNSGPLLLEPMQRLILAEAPQARFVRMTAPPVVGALLLGMQVAGVATAVLRRRLLESAAAQYEGVQATPSR